jgi:DNA-binding XRE family transcriptional regulator
VIWSCQIPTIFAILNEKSRNVKTLKTKLESKEEIMLPYSRVLYISWDKDVGGRLQEMRIAKGVSQQKLANLTEGKVSRETIQKLEYGTVDSVSREKLDILLTTLGTSVQSLFLTVTVCLPLQ